MTAQRDLGLVWALSGGVLPVDSTKYQSGWVAEIPTYQQFNYMVQGIDGNVLHLAEESVFDWQDDITYQIGARVKRNGTVYCCITVSINNDPATDSTNSYWVTGSYTGLPTRLKQTDGQRIDFTLKSDSTWVGQEQTIYGKTPMTGYFTNDATKNWGLANFSGELVVVDLGASTDTIPDNRNINKTGPNTHRIFHEGHLPTASEVVGGVEEAPNDNKLYARRGITATSGQWEEVTTTTVSTSPPPPVRGAGQGWFNLDDGQLYIDVDDGDSVQWVPANSPYVPASIGGGGVTPDAVNITYDNTTSGLTATEVQAALDELAASGGGGSYNAVDIGFTRGSSSIEQSNVQGALYELDTNISNLAAADLSYDNTTSGLSATNVKTALDELATTAPSAAGGISFDDTVVSEGFTDVQQSLEALWLRVQQIEGGV